MHIFRMGNVCIYSELSSKCVWKCAGEYKVELVSA